MKEKEKIKIAFFIPTLEGGGAEKNIINFVKNFDKGKFLISIVLGEKKGELLSGVPKNISIIELGTINSIKIFFRLIKYFHTTEADIFISAFPRFNIISLLARKFSKSKIKIILTEHIAVSFLLVVAKTFGHKFVARFFILDLIKLFYPMAESIVCVSKCVAKDISKIVSCHNKIKVIYNPVIDERVYRLMRESVNHSWFLNSKIPVILSVGRLVPGKDFSVLLQAFALVLQEQPVYLVILGEGKEKQKLKKLAQNLEISNNVDFLGFQKNPYKYMAKSSIFVLSSRIEGFGNVIVEAMACGTPVVSTNFPFSGPNEIIENKKNGILVPARDSKALSTAILELLNNSSLREKIAEQGKKRAQDFSVEKSVKEYENLFEQVLNKND